MGGGNIVALALSCFYQHLFLFPFVIYGVYIIYNKYCIVHLMNSIFTFIYNYIYVYAYANIMSIESVKIPLIKRKQWQ